MINVRIITKNPRDVIPPITESDITKNIVIIVQNIRPDTYIVVMNKISNHNCESVVGNISGLTIWQSFRAQTLIELLITEYVMFGCVHSEIIVLETRQDVINAIQKYNISNNQIISMLLSKRFGDII